MRSQLMRLSIFIILCIAGGHHSVRAFPITTDLADCNNSSGNLTVQNAINAASAGDVIRCPATAGAVTWDTALSIPAKNITFEGQSCTMLSKLPSKAITAISVANPTHITVVGHGITNGSNVLVVGTNSTPVINNVYVATVLDADHFTIPVNVTGSGSAGLARPACPTVITGNISGGVIIGAAVDSVAHFLTMSDFTLQTTSYGSGSGMINIGPNSVSGVPPIAIRLFHIQFNGDTTDGTTDLSNNPRWLDSNVFGVIDHSEFLAQTSRGMGNASADKDGGSTPAYQYHHPFSLGDQNALYIEDCFFYSTRQTQGNSAVDNYINRYVFRMNTVYNNNVGNHGYDSQARGVMSLEQYGNTYIADVSNGSGSTSAAVTNPRSGTGMIWGNLVENMSGTANTYSAFFTPIYYGGVNMSDFVNCNGGIVQRPAAAYPNAPWSSYNGMHASFAGKTYVGFGSLDTIDGNQFGLDNFDSDYSRTVTDLHTTSGSATITSATASFVTGCGVASGDLGRFVVASNFKRGRIASACTVSGTTLTCSGESFDAGDVGRYIFTDNRTTFGSANFVRIDSISSDTVAVLHTAGSGVACSPCDVVLAEPFVISVTNSTTAVMSVPATASTSAGTLSIGYTNQGYPLLDQPGRGYFATANAGNWPSASSYTDANFEALMPIYLFGNQLVTTNSSLVFSSCTNSTSCIPPATAVNYASTAAYMKANREWYDPVGGLQTSSSSPFNGTVGTGIGTKANRPTTCTIGVGYWAVDEGSWNHGSFSYVPDHGAGTVYTQGNLYQCTATNTWGLYYTPLTYPHPLEGTTPLRAGGLGMNVVHE